MAANVVVLIVLVGISGFCLYTENIQGCALSVAAASLVGLLILFHFRHGCRKQAELQLTRIIHSGTSAKYCACCAICLTDFTESEKLTQLPCLHAFHKECFECWMAKSNSCPHCRAVFRSPESATV